MSWQLQEAKQRFSELVRLVLQLDLPRLAGYRAHGGLLGSGPVSPSELLEIPDISRTCSGSAFSSAASLLAASFSSPRSPRARLSSRP